MVKEINTKSFSGFTLPNDWEIIEFGKLFEFKNGVNASKDSYGNGVKFINVMEIIYHNCITADMITGSVKISDKQINDFLVKRGDVLFNRTSETTNEIGLSAVYLDDEKVVFGGFVIRGVPKDKTLYDEYKKYCFHSKFVRDQIVKGGQGAVRSNIGQGDLEKVKLPVPPLPEQKSIAHILGLMDDSINKNIQLIVQKELRKKWLMQSLLTGKKRLKGFTEKWKNIVLGEIGEFKTSSVDKVLVDGEEIVNLVNYMDVYRNRFITPEFQCKKTSVNERELITFNLLKGDILFTPSSETPDDIGHSAVVTADLEKTVFSYHLVRYRLFEDTQLAYDFRAYVFNNQNILNEFSRRATGSTRFTLSKSSFEEIEAKIPTTIEEQISIAKVLQSADKEIQNLKCKTELLREQKKGLMQVLLTGKKRLKVLTS